MNRLESVVINVLDLEREVDFWMDFLRTSIARSVDGFTWLAARDGEPSVALQLVEHAAEGPRRLHLDFSTDDVETEVSRVVTLGGSIVARHQVADFAWTIVADPEGNEFCLSLTHN